MIVKSNSIVINHDKAEYFVNADRKILTDALVNVLENAVKYSEKNTVLEFLALEPSNYSLRVIYDDNHNKEYW